MENLSVVESHGWGDGNRDLSTLVDKDFSSGSNNNNSGVATEVTSTEPQLKELRLEKYSENNGVANIALAPKLDILPEQTHKENEVDGNQKDDAKENVPCFLPALEVPGRKYHSSSDKRRLNDVKRRKAESSSDSSSSDDEIKELFSQSTTKCRISSSKPPGKIHAVSSSFIFCQRRRSRGSSPRFQPIPRPSINFDKMQQNIVLRRHRSRFVRVKTLPVVTSGARSCDPSKLGFKPIASLNPCINHLAPVEDPLAF